MNEFPLSTEELDELLPLYALGGLSAEETAQVEQYLATHPDKQAEVAEYSLAASVLADATPPMTPPLAIKSAVFDHVRETAPISAEMPAVAPKVVVKSRQPSLGERASSAWERLQTSLFFPLATAGAVAAVAILAVQLSNTNSELESLQTTNTVLTTENEQLVAQNEQLTETLLRQDEVVAFLTDTSVQRHSIAGTEASPNAVGQLLIGQGETEGLLLVSNLAELPADQTYQFWVIGEEPVSAGVFGVDDFGDGQLPVSLSAPIDAYAAMGVSVEPSGGSVQPTGDIVMLAELASADS